MDDPSDWTPLHTAVWHQRSLQDVENLANSTSVNAVDAEGWTPVHLACSSSESMLMFSHQTPNRPAWRSYGSVLGRPPPRFGYGESARRRALEVLRVLLRHRPDLSIRAKGFCTALHCAANSVWFSHVKLLVDEGAAVYTGPECSPLCWSAGGSGGMDDVGAYLRQRLGPAGLAMIEADHERDLQEARRRQMQQTIQELGVTLSDDEIALQQALMDSVIGQNEPVEGVEPLSGVLPRAPAPPDLAQGALNEHGLCKTCAGMSVSKMKSPPGYLHMPSLEDLGRSAESCRLCALIYSRLSKGSYGQWYSISQIIIRLSNGNHFNCTDPSVIRTIDFMISEGCTCGANSRSAEPSPFYDKCEGRCKFAKQDSMVIYVKEEHLDIQKGLDINQNPMSESNRKTILNWLQNCDQNHVICKRDGILTASKSLLSSLPTRVVEVGDGVVRLVDGKGKQGQYLALSHRWLTGDKPEWVTRRDSIDDRRHWFPASVLPATLTDAFKITRWLGFKYIWIDTLCIVQDSSADWSRESAMMASIYADSYCTLFADCAQDDNDNFLKPRRPYSSLAVPVTDANPDQPLTLHIREEPGTFDMVQKTLFDRTVQESHLSDRGWIFQERILSKRILHFGKDRIFWQCNELVQAEDGHVVTEDECGDREPRFSKRSCSIAVGSSLPYQALRKRISLLRRYSGGPNWMNVVAPYTRLKLTHGNDKLPALAGLASAFARRNATEGNVYIAGLWKSSLASMLAWSVDCPLSRLAERPSVTRPPTFSWAATDHPVKFVARDAQRWTEVSKFVSAVAKSETETSDQYGRLKSCHLTVEGPVMELITYGPLPQDYDGISKGCVPLYLSDETNRCPVGQLEADYLLDPELSANKGGTKVTCLHLLTPEKDDSVSKYSHDQFLVLQPIPGDGQMYRRLGMGSTKTSTGAQGFLDNPLFEDAEVRTITLV